MGDYAYSAEDLLVRVYQNSWVETDQIVPDQITPARNTTSMADSGTGIAGFSIEYTRGDHQHPLQVSIVLHAKDTATGEEGTATTYASIDPTIANVSLVNATVAANGTSDYYCRNDHVHPQQLTYNKLLTSDKFIKNGAQSIDVLLANGDSKPIIDINGDGFVGKTGKTFQMFEETLRYSGDDEEQSDNEDYLPKKIKNGFFNLQLNQMIPSVIAGTATTNGATNWSVNYSAGNLIF
ncbi:MAG: hypothetical protein EZS28_013000 [Streblomastix strix]|uniref:Uncharacterized protein n=1 Tax=Streblomastix strix TaxID=222440 RepID=A0A5J4W9Z2_9EUKA|nr:MAG: hypothetical protein EZS28_013000 [Streblomastix strix]